MKILVNGDWRDVTTNMLAAALESWLTTRAGAVLPSAQEASAFLKRTIDRCGSFVLGLWSLVR